MTDLENIVMAKEDMLIDIGGTPDNVLSQDKASIAYKQGIKPEQLVIILDPINQARQTRTLVLGDFSIKNIKFEIGDVDDPDFTAESAPAPSYEYVRKKFDAARSSVLGNIIDKYGHNLKDRKALEMRYDKMAEDISALTKKSPNMREFMNSIVEYLFYPVKVVKMEDVFSKNPNITYDLMKRVEKYGWQKKSKDETGTEKTETVYEIPVRTVCPLDKLFVNNKLGKDLDCCGVPADGIIKSGKFVPEGGFFPLFVYLNGYKMFLKEGHPYTESATKLFKDYGFENVSPFELYPASKKKVAKFESKLMEGMLKDN